MSAIVRRLENCYGRVRLMRTSDEYNVRRDRKSRTPPSTGFPSRTIGPEGRWAVTAQDPSRSGGVDLRREDRVPLRGSSVWFAQAAAVRCASQTARLTL
jgi:hypothetical protein